MSARDDFPEIASAIDAIIASGIKQGMTPEQSKAGVRWRWAYNRHTGKELGTAPAGAREAAERIWAELDKQDKA